MKVYNPTRIRNVVLLGHSGSGKTTLAETMLFEAGAINRRGSVEEKNTVSDYHDLEKEKQKSIYSSFLNLDWRGHKINLIDTPGTSDYIGEVAGAVRIADTAIFVLNAEQGVETATNSLWKYVQKYTVPSMFVVNKLDTDQSDFWKTVDEAREQFGREVTVVQFPYSEGSDFHAIIDVLRMTMYEFPEGGGKPDKLPIPDSLKPQAEKLHQELVETIAENDETLMDIYFEQGELDEEQMEKGLHISLVNGQIFPLFCSCASLNMGTGRVMGFLDDVAPNPLQGNPPKTQEGEVFELDPDGKPVMFLFKTHSESHVGDLIYFKVYNGSVQPGMDLVNSSNSSSVRLGNLFLTEGHKRIEINEIKTGDIGAVVKLKDSEVNDTLHEKGDDVKLEGIEFPPTTIRTAVKLTKEGDEDKLGHALHQIHREDPSVVIEHSQELRQVIIHGQGEEHLSVIEDQLENRFNLDVEFITPKIPYRETITSSVRTQYKHKKQSGGAGQFAEVQLLIEPLKENMDTPDDLKVRDVQEIELDWGGKLVFQNCIVGGVIDNRFMPAIIKGIMEKMENGPMSGCRARDIRVSVYDGSMHSVDSNEAAFKTAARMAFKDGFMKAKPQLMEPVYEIEVTVPSDYMGDVMSDLSTRRGQIQGMDGEGSIQKIKAFVPLEELDHYSTRLKSMTQGSASYTREFAHYAQVPHDVQERVVKENLELEEA
ncbi:elongation factor G [Gracilimonas mengyeensis]|uniref:Elongation factor G n=1 Tax=Gracilimonas mengyeensis TaxID=1302730 RepID=A0A521D4Y4_9BACT|nr:elongation factor G [Gracilimonas mengyeensis]SMO66766.1 translation elongation factor 2 (EF-2/EF-G) [Gracilimonas mengyeensis]